MNELNHDSGLMEYIEAELEPLRYSHDEGERVMQYEVVECLTRAIDQWVRAQN